MSRYIDGLATTLAGAAIPYGYTLVVWSSGSVVAERHGRPDVWDVAAFAAGAAAAYGVLRIVSERGRVLGPAGIARRGLIRGGLVHLTAIAAAIAAVALVARLPGAAAWTLGPFASTFAYLGGTAFNEAREIEARRADT